MYVVVCVVVCAVYAVYFSGLEEWNESSCLYCGAAAAVVQEEDGGYVSTEHERQHKISLLSFRVFPIVRHSRLRYGSRNGRMNCRCRCHHVRPRPSIHPSGFQRSIGSADHDADITRRLRINLLVDYTISD